MINASSIQEHMIVVDARGNHVGTVDHMEGSDQIKLTRTDSPDGLHHYIPLDWVDSVDDQVHLNKNNSDIAAQKQ